ncbi:MAG: AtpZ/AtpI family protein [Flavobacterium sp.]|nr:MAG: AtpZ/AtpI family protein [Flavobacterium sp.]
MSNNNQQDKKSRNKWIVLISMPLQMGLIIFLFAWFGTWLDEKYGNNENPNRTLFALIGVALAMYNVIRQVNELNKYK